MLKIPCPLDDDKESNQRIEEIMVFKRLRSNFNIDEKAVCFKCKRECPVRGLLVKDIDYKTKSTNKAALHDIFLYFTFLLRLNES
jgi:hypothetical protein